MHVQTKYRLGIGMTPSATALGKFLRSRRLELGISQVKLAELTGMCQVSYSALETGRYGYRALANHLDKLAQALQCDLSVLRTFIPPPKEPRTALGKFIRCRRQKAGLSVEELAEKLNIRKVNITLLELGKRERIQRPTAFKLANALNVSVKTFNDFISHSGFPAKEPESFFGRIIRSKRKEMDLTLRDVAKTLSVSHQLISQIEQGKHILSGDALLNQLAKVLQIDPKYLRSIRPKRRIKIIKKASIEHGSLAEFVFNRRIECGLSQKEVARRVGVKTSIIFLIEAGNLHQKIQDSNFWNNLAYVLKCNIPVELLP